MEYIHTGSRSRLKGLRKLGRALHENPKEVRTEKKGGHTIILENEKELPCLQRLQTGMGLGRPASIQAFYDMQCMWAAMEAATAPSSTQ